MTGPLSSILGLLKHPLTDSGLAQFLADHQKRELRSNLVAYDKLQLK